MYRHQALRQRLRVVERVAGFAEGFCEPVGDR
jgi:hypothetical protein